MCLSEIDASCFPSAAVAKAESILYRQCRIRRHADRGRRFAILESDDLQRTAVMEPSVGRRCRDGERISLD